MTTCGKKIRKVWEVCTKEVDEKYLNFEKNQHFMLLSLNFVENELKMLIISARRAVFSVCSENICPPKKLGLIVLLCGLCK